jgi:hypothetical protein
VTGGEAAVLVLALVALAFVLVPAHWTSIWLDREFTGGVGPLANRLVDGQRLYTDGMHSPIPPLSFVLMRVVGGGDATWLTGSVVNYVFQALTLGVTWLALRRTFGARVGFVATLCTVPIFLSLPKTVLYDAVVEFWVAVAAWIVAVLPRRWPVLLGAVSAAAIMTKQSTGLGVVAGALLGLVVASPEARPFAARWWRTCALYLAGLVLAGAVLVAAFAPWADPGGFVHDALVTGAEPKGTPGATFDKVVRWARDVALFAGPYAAAIALVVLGDRRFGLRERLPGARAASWWRVARQADAHRLGPLGLSGAAVTGAALGAGSWSLDARRLADPWTLGPAWFDDHLLKYRFPSTFAAVMAVAGLAYWRHHRRPDEGTRRFLAVFSVLVCAAVGMSLSGPRLRWTYDNNPLIAFGLACVIVTVIWLARLISSHGVRATALSAVGTFLVSALCWASLGDQIWVANSADRTWPEIAHLKGAGLRPESSGARTLVGRVRALAGPHEEVLLLPEDPNVQAWFERPRPKLTSAMVFPDQYWDRYVDEDFDRLAADPPKVVVIGPRGFWRTFSHIVHVNWGAERLIDRVQRELLPQRYAMAPAVRVRVMDHDDWMDVAVRRGP